MAKLKSTFQQMIDILKGTKNPILNEGFTANGALQILKATKTLRGRPRKINFNAQQISRILNLSDEIEIITKYLDYESPVAVYKFKEKII